MSVTEPLEWQVAIYVANEAERLDACIESVVADLAGTKYRITILLNGSHDGSAAIAVAAAQRFPTIEVFSIRYPDKSNAINQFYHRLRVPARLYASVDGYVVVRPGAFAALAAHMVAHPEASTVSGFAVNGRTLPRPDTPRPRAGRVMGGMHALRPRFLDGIVARQLRLPVGLYRGDGLIGSMAAHDLDALGTTWDDQRILSEAKAEVEVQRLSPFRPTHVHRQFQRMLRQMRGRIENAALEIIIYRDGFTGLPEFADDMIARHLAQHGSPKVSLPNRAFMRMAIRRSAAASRPAAEDLLPVRL
jgi:hypothetical protein